MRKMKSNEKCEKEKGGKLLAKGTMKIIKNKMKKKKSTSTDG